MKNETETVFQDMSSEDKLMSVIMHVKGWTKEQIESMRDIHERSPIYRGGISGHNLVAAAGWTFRNHCDLPLNIHSGLWLWSHPKHPTDFFNDHHDIITRYKLGTKTPLLEFMMCGWMDSSSIVMVRVDTITLGIEKDGYIHS